MKERRYTFSAASFLIALRLGVPSCMAADQLGRSIRTSNAEAKEMEWLLELAEDVDAGRRARAQDDVR